MPVAVVVGQTLTCNPGTWTNSPQTPYIYQWQRDGTTNIGANQNTYQAVLADVGHTIDCVVTAHNTSGTSPPVESNVTAAVTSGTSATWPASYFTGPLGGNNVLPNARPGLLLSLWAGVSGYSPSQQRAFVAQRITDMGRGLDLIGFAADSAASPGSAQLDVSSSDLSENWIHLQGAVPFVTWDPGTSTDYAGVANGMYDSNINSAASRFKAFGHRIMVRMFEEFNIRGTWNASDFVNAWRHVVNLYKSNDATNVGWVWCPGEQADSTNRTEVFQSYPGDTYIDWASSDGYNLNSNTGGSAPCLTGWAEFNAIYNFAANLSQCGGDNSQSTELQYGPTKPFFPSECSSKYDTPDVPIGHTVDPNRKANWFRNIASVAVPAMPYLIGIQFFDQDVHVSESGNNWRVDSACDHSNTNNLCNNGATDANTYQGFKDMANTAVFKVGVAGGAS